jgi:hypothetical protein
VIFCPFLHESVFDESFQRILEHLLSRAVRIYIGFGMPEHENRSPSKSHLNVVQKLENLRAIDLELWHGESGSLLSDIRFSGAVPGPQYQ